MGIRPFKDDVFNEITPSSRGGPMRGWEIIKSSKPAKYIREGHKAISKFSWGLKLLNIILQVFLLVPSRSYAIQDLMTSFNIFKLYLQISYEGRVRFLQSNLCNAFGLIQRYITYFLFYFLYAFSQTHRRCMYVSMWVCRPGGFSILLISTYFPLSY